MAELIAFAMGNFTLTFLVLGLIAALIAVARKPDGFTRANIAEVLLAYFILFSIGFSFFYNFVFHVFFGELAASYIGWADSPFQAEVGYASLGFAAVGLLAFKGGLLCSPRRYPRPSDVPVGRRCRSHQSDHDDGQHGPGQCRHHALLGYSPAGHWICAAVVQADDECRMIRFRHGLASGSQLVLFDTVC